MTRPAAPIGTAGEAHDAPAGTLGRQPSCEGPVGWGNPALSRDVHLTVSAIREGRQAILKRLRQIEEQLAHLGQCGLSEAGTWGQREYQSDWSIQVVGARDAETGKVFTLREALEGDARALHAELRRLSAEARASARRDLRKTAQASSHKFDEELGRVLREGEKTGSVDFDALIDLRRSSEQAILDWIDAVERSPTQRNMQSLVEQIGKACAAGYDEGSPAVRRAWDLLAGVTARQSAQAEKRFRAEPSTANLRAWSDAAARAMTFGDVAAPGALPPGVERRGEERRYVIRSGDTLSAISKRFYGSAAYWDVIYFANAKKIGDDPDKPPDGVELLIPP